MTLCSAGKYTVFTCWPALPLLRSASSLWLARASGRGHARLAFLQRGERATSWVLRELQSRRQHTENSSQLIHRKPSRTREKQNFVILSLLDLEAKCRGCCSGTQVFYANSSCWASVSPQEMGSLVSTEAWRGQRARSLREHRRSM